MKPGCLSLRDCAHTDVLKFVRNLKEARNQRREPQNRKPILTVEEKVYGFAKCRNL